MPGVPEDELRRRREAALVTLTPEERKKIRAARKAVRENKMPHADRCAICNHEERAVIDAAYVGWKPETMICEVWGFSEVELADHVKRTGKLQERRDNTESLYERIIMLGMAFPEKLEITAKDVMQAAQRLDKLGGREVERHEYQHGPPTLVFVGIPRPGGVLGKPEEKTLPGKVVQVGPPALPQVSEPVPQASEASEPTNQPSETENK